MQHTGQERIVSLGNQVSKSVLPLRFVILHQTLRRISTSKGSKFHAGRASRFIDTWLLSEPEDMKMVGKTYTIVPYVLTRLMTILVSILSIELFHKYQRNYSSP